MYHMTATKQVMKTAIDEVQSTKDKPQARDTAFFVTTWPGIGLYLGDPSR